MAASTTQDSEPSPLEFSNTYHYFKRWAQCLIHGEYYDLPWDKIEFDLSNNVAHNEKLKQTLYIKPESDLHLTDDTEIREYNKLIDLVYGVNNPIFDRCGSILDFILCSSKSPLYIAFYGVPKDSELQCDYQQSIQRMKDAIKILQLLIEHNIIDGDNGQDDIRRQLEMFNSDKNKYTKFIIKEWIDLVLLLNEHTIDQWSLMNVVLDSKKYNDWKQQTENENEKNVTDDEESKHYLSGNFWHHVNGWDIEIPTNTNIIQQLLFKGIKPFQFVIVEGDKKMETKTEQEWRKWFDSLVKELKVLDIEDHMNNDKLLSSIDQEHLKAIIAPFVMYPYFSEARNKMFKILSEYIPMHQDCLTVILQYLYIDNTLYEYYYDKYKDNQLLKAMELSIYIKLMPNVRKNKFFLNNIFKQRFDDPIVLKLYLNCFEEQIIDNVPGLDLVGSWLIKYKDKLRLSNKGYYNLLAQALFNIRYKGNKPKRKFKKYLDLLSISPLVTNSDIHWILNYYDNEVDTLLMRAIDMFSLKQASKQEISIMKELVQHKELDLNISTIRGYISNAFDAALYYDKSALCDLLLNARKLSIDTICNVVNEYVLQRPTYPRKHGWRNNIARIGTYLTHIYQHKKLNKRKKQLVKDTRRNIRRYLRRHSR